MKQKFFNPTREAMSQVGSRFGSAIAKIVVANLDENLKTRDAEERLEVPVRVFTLEVVEINEIKKMEIDGKIFVQFNNNRDLTFNPSDIIYDGKSPEALGGKQGKWIGDLEYATTLVNMLNDAEAQRILKLNKLLKTYHNAVIDVKNAENAGNEKWLK